jgi:hypothetical protein
MFGIPGEIFWPTAAFGTLILLVLGGIVLLRLLPHKSRQLDSRDRDALEDVQARLNQLDQLQERVSDLEERADFAERILSKQREGERLIPPKA